MTLQFVINCIFFGLVFTRLLQIVEDIYSGYKMKLYSTGGIIFGIVFIFLIQFGLGFILVKGYEFIK